MTINEYQRQAALSQPRKNFETRKDMINHAVLEINSEAGEIASIFQKEYQGHPVDTEHVMKEMGDVLWGISELCDAMECTLEDIMRMNIDKLSARYPEGFSEERSLHRLPGDI